MNNHSLKTNKNILNKLFSFFKILPSQRNEALRPVNGKTWIINGFSEFLGTFILSFALAGLSIYINKSVVEHYFLSKVFLGLFSGFGVVGVCMFIFLRWSCDLNPIISITKYLKGMHNGWYVSYKIFIQILAGILAGIIVYLIGIKTSGQTQDGYTLANAPVDAINSTETLFKILNLNQIGKLYVGGTVIFCGELIMSMILLFSIFSSTIKDKYRDVVTLFIISMAFWVGILSGSAAINPVRGLAQQLPTLFVGNYSSEFMVSVTVATLAMILGNLLSTVIYVFMQGFNEYFFNPMLHKIIFWKNNSKSAFITDQEYKQFLNSKEKNK
ncbi:MIP/aquaporin family protein [Mycoplasmopsis cricetuli]|uniref:aquaporin n=1 Tax=Mycoplasmopsis cricetuli TaxID=171283 RepID=UPI000471A98E|nr:aquaporin [Mycoplasmopsis cricetuli]